MSYINKISKEIFSNDLLRFKKLTKQSDGSITVEEIGDKTEIDKVLNQKFGEVTVRDGVQSLLDRFVDILPPGNFNFSTFIELLNKSQEFEINQALENGQDGYFVYLLPLNSYKNNLSFSSLEAEVKSKLQEAFLSSVTSVEEIDTKIAVVLSELLVKNNFKYLKDVPKFITDVVQLLSTDSGNLDVKFLQTFAEENALSKDNLEARLNTLLATDITDIVKLVKEYNNKVSNTSIDYSLELLEEYLKNNPHDGEVVDMYKKRLFINYSSENLRKDLIFALKDINSISEQMGGGLSDEMYSKVEELINILDLDLVLDHLSGNTSETLQKINEILEEDILKNSELAHLVELHSKIKRFNKSKLRYNPLFTLLKSMSADLYGRDSEVTNIFDLIKNEVKELQGVSNLEEYVLVGSREDGLNKALHLLEVLSSVVTGVTSTDDDIDIDDMDSVKIHNYGYLQLRKLYAKKYNISNYVTEIEGISPIDRELVQNDINLLKAKINFLKEFALSNSKSIVTEQENVRRELTNVISTRIKEASTTFPKELEISLTELGSKSFDFEEQRYYEQAHIIYNYFKDKSSEDKIEFLRSILKNDKMSFDLIAFSDLRSNMKPQDLLDRDFYTQLMVMMTIDLKNFNKRFEDLLEEGAIDKVPFFTQELSIQLALAYTVDPKLFGTFVEEFSSEKEHSVIKNVLILLGVGGSGKTTVLFKTYIELLKQDNPNLSIWFAAPHEDQVKKLRNDALNSEKGVTVKSFNSLSLFNELGLTDLLNSIKEQLALKEGTELTDLEEKNGKLLIFDPEKRRKVILSELAIDSIKKLVAENKELPQIIFIDENSHFDVVEYEALNLIAEEFDIKIITTGDPNQMGKNIVIRDTHTPANIDYIVAPTNMRLLFSIRSLNSVTKTNLDRSLTLLRNVEGIAHGIIKGKKSEYLSQAKELGITELGYDLNQGPLKGHRILNTEENFTQLTSLKGEKVAVLTPNGEMSTEFSNMLTANGIDLENITVFSLNNLQGNESDYFIFDANLTLDSNGNVDFLKYYTFITRAKRGTFIIDLEKKLDTIGIVNVYRKATDFIPLDNVFKEATNTRIEVLKKLNEGVIGKTIFSFNVEEKKEDEENEVEVVSEVEEDSFLDSDPNINTRTEKEKSHQHKDSKFILYTFYNNTSSNKVIDLNKPIIEELKKDSSISNSNFNIDLDLDKVEKFKEL